MAAVDEISLDDCYDTFPRVEAAFQARLDESLHPRGPDSLWELFERLEPRRDAVAVDVGCGGDDALELARRFGLLVHGVDPVPRHIALASRAARDASLHDRVSLASGAAERLPVADASVDLVWAKEAWHVHRMTGKLQGAAFASGPQP